MVLSSVLLLRASSSSVARSLPAARSRRLASAVPAVAASRATRRSLPRTAISTPLPPSLSSRLSSPPPTPPPLATFSVSRSLRAPAFPSAAAAAAMSPADSKKKRALIPVADGTEEMEAVIVADVLRRAGADVAIASVEKENRKEVVCSRGIRIVADISISEIGADDIFDAVVLPGGMPGAERLRDSEELTSLLERHRSKAAAAASSSSSSSSEIVLAAICAAPQVVFDAPGRGILDGKKATAHPAFSGKLKDASAAESRVVVDGNVVTSRGPGTAFEFALCLVEKLFGKAKAEEVAGPMVMAKAMEEPLVVSK